MRVAILATLMAVGLTACGDGGNASSGSDRRTLTVQFSGDCKVPVKAPFKILDGEGNMLASGKLSPSAGCNNYIEPRVAKASTYRIQVQGLGTLQYSAEQLAACDYWIEWEQKTNEPKCASF